MDDLISRQASIDALRQQFKKSPTTAIRAMNTIEELPPAQQWIPCSDRLPEEETDVFICNANGDRAISRGSYSTEAKDDFIWYTSGWRFGKAIAWMPLPEPYKGDANDG